MRDGNFLATDIEVAHSPFPAGWSLQFGATTVRDPIDPELTPFAIDHVTWASRSGQVCAFSFTPCQHPGLHGRWINREGRRPDLDSPEASKINPVMQLCPE